MVHIYSVKIEFSVLYLSSGGKQPYSIFICVIDSTLTSYISLLYESSISERTIIVKGKTIPVTGRGGL
jgi:hypothetical protein